MNRGVGAATPSVAFCGLTGGELFALLPVTTLGRPAANRSKSCHSEAMENNNRAAPQNGRPFAAR